MKVTFIGKKDTLAERITVTIDLGEDQGREKDAWDILEGFSRLDFRYWDLVR